MAARTLKLSKSKRTRTLMKTKKWGEKSNLNQKIQLAREQQKLQKTKKIIQQREE